MTDGDPPDFVIFRDATRPATIARPEIYQLALDFTARVFQVIEVAAMERFHLKDQLDRRSTAIAVLVAQARDTPGGPMRRARYQQARRAAMDCSAILDILHQRNTVEASVLAPARAMVADLLARLAQLAIR
jgi:four helix bundle protein